MVGNFLKKGVREMMIARPDEAKEFILYKHPDETIPFGSQLTVDADEMAVFFRDGRVHGLVQPGRYPLTSYNIPFLSNLVDQFTGGNLFKAEVYFVLTREYPNLKFGGKIGAVEDPKSGVPVVTMVHGTFSIKVTDPAKLIIGLAGMAKSDNTAFIDWFREQTLKVMRDRIAELLVKKHWPILDVTSGAYTEEIEQEVVAGVAPYLVDYGVKVMKCGNFVISIADEDRENLKKLYTDAAYVRMAGGIQQYQQFAGGKALMGAGEGMAKGGGADGGGGAVLGGAGLGVGFGLAQMFGQNMQQAQGQGQAAPQQGGGAGGQPPGYPQPSVQAGAAGAAAGAAAGLVLCSACGAKVAPGKFCAECGKTLSSQKKFCPQCGGEVKTDAKFCSECGQKF
jgi:membrane protease subunit (stomatin/prohibitin family)